LLKAPKRVCSTRSLGGMGKVFLVGSILKKVQELWQAGIIHQWSSDKKISKFENKA